LEVTIVTTVNKTSFLSHFNSFLKTEWQLNTIDLESEKKFKNVRSKI